MLQAMATGKGTGSSQAGGGQLQGVFQHRNNIVDMKRKEICKCRAKNILCAYIDYQFLFKMVTFLVSWMFFVLFARNNDITGK